MKHRLDEWRAAGKHWHAVVALFAANSLVALLWAARVIWIQACVADTILCPSKLQALVALTVAVGFNTAALVAWLAGQAGWGAAFLLLISSAMAVGAVTSIAGEADPARYWFYLLLAWLAPITFRFHHSLLDRPPRWFGRAAIALLVGLAVAASVPLVIWLSTLLPEGDWFAVVRSGVRLGLVLALALGWLLLLREYRQGSTPNVRRRIRLVVFGTLFGFAPFVFLSLMPDTFGIVDRLSYEATFPFLLLSPLAYLYSIFRHRLTRSDVVFSRAAVYYLSITLLLSAFLVTVAVLNRFVIGLTDYLPAVSAVMSVAFVILFVPLKRALEKFLSWVLYGSDIAYAPVVSRLTESLSMTLDRETLRQLLIEELPHAMRLARCALYLKDAEGDLVLFAASPAPVAPPAQVLSSGSGLTARLASTIKPLSREQIYKTTRNLSLSDAERAAIAQTWTYWVPLVSADVMRGLLLVSRPPDEDYFTREEEQILATVARQTAVAIHNLELMEEVCAGQQELTQAHRQLLATREREQRRLAHELHDEALQNLLGLSFQLATERKALGNGRGPLNTEGHAQALDTVRSGMLAVVRQLRALIGELRPVGLEEMGLPVAIGSYVEHLKQEGGSDIPEIQLQLSGDPKRIPPPVAICFFRTAQEALRNAVRHANASFIELSLHIREHQVELVIVDNGIGFQTPRHLSELASCGHYGLVGMQEQVAWAGGDLCIQSEPGAGTMVRVVIPLDSSGGGNGKDDSSSLGG